jgi:putative peptide maturation dehydrogenase
MPWVRRTRHLALSVSADDEPHLVARSLLNGTRVQFTAAELTELLALPIRSWTWRPEGDVWVDRLGRDGLVVSDDPNDPFPRLRRQDELMTTSGWWPDAAALHAGARWDGVKALVPGPDGVPPPTRPRVGDPLPALPVRGGPQTPLPPSARDSALRDVLARRRTVRAFDANRPVTVDELATILRWVWGAHGTARLVINEVGLRRTSPSGGALHPIEVYPVVRRVEGVAPGLYHYLGGQHALEQIRPLDADSAHRLVEDATAGQWYFANADVAFVMTARFRRSFRKYRYHPKIYRAIFLDAGHLSQTFYLLCTELGLGPWITAALDEAVLERALGVEPLDEGIIAVVGCGRPAADGKDVLALRVAPLERG